jgi:hypothetical protein
MPTKAFQLGRDKVTLEAVREVAEFGRKVVLTPAAKKRSIVRIVIFKVARPPAKRFTE